MTMGVPELINRAKQTGVKRGDLILVALLLVISAALMCMGLLGGRGGSQVRVCVDGQQVAVLPLDTDTRYEIPGGCGNVLEISGGKVRMLSADCPDESCVAQGFIFRAGECIVCLPGRVTATVMVDDHSAELDAVAY